MKDQEMLLYLRNNKHATALKGLYHVFPAIKKFIIGNSGTKDDAMDIFQDALVILYKKAQSTDFVLTSPLKFYLLGIAKNCWMQELRRRNKIRNAENLPEPIPNDTDADERKYNMASAAFYLLGEQCRQLLLQFYYHKKSFKEIALTLAFSDEKVAKNQKYRCLQKAKENYLTLSTKASHE